MSQSSAEGRYQFQSKTVEIEGHEFALREPDGFECINAVGVVMSLIGEPDKMLDEMRAVLSEPGDVVSHGLTLGFKMSLAKGRYQRVPKDDILDLLEMTTDKDRAWFAANRLSGEALLELVAEVASILPFGGVLSQKANLAGALVTSFTGSSEKSETSSGNGGDGDQKTSPGAGSAGPSHAAVNLKSAPPAEN